MYQSEYTPLIHRRELKEILQLSSPQIKYLIDNFIIFTKQIGKKEIVHIPSLRSFQSSFNRNDYMTKSEVISKLNEKRFRAQYIPELKMYDKDFIGFQHTFNKFVSKGYLIDYRIGTTVYVTKKSFNHLYKLLDDTYNELYMNVDFEKMYNSEKSKKRREKKKRKRKGLSGTNIKNHIH